MKKSLLFLFALVSSAILVAAPVEPQRAKALAKSLVPVSASSQHGAKAQLQGDIVYTHYMPKSGRPAIYVVNVGNAFVLVSADDVAHPVLGYNYMSSWPTDGQLPPQVKAFLDDLAAQMEAALEHPQDAEIAAEWQQPNRTPRRQVADNLPDSVGPLLTTAWNQGQYYNALCPADDNGEDGHCPTGCVATAMAQIIKYWGDRETIHTRGIHSYQSNYGELRVNYDSTTYDFASMPEVLTFASTETQINAVAKLMYECGVAVNMQYDANESGALNPDVRAALVNYFNYSPTLNYAEKRLMPDEEWVRLMKSNISVGEPTLYSGVDAKGGHLFVCDGYKSGNYLHFNFGWGGIFDGWYLHSAINAGVYEFNSSQTAIVDIVYEESDNNSTLYTQYQRGQHSYFTVYEPIHLRNLMADNVYQYGNYSLFNNGQTITFLPTDTTHQITLCFATELMADAYIYDGKGTDSLLRSIKNEGGYYYHVETSPITSTRHALTVQFIGAEMIKGVDYVLMEDNGCGLVSNLTLNADSTMVHLSWDANDLYQQWQVEYGLEGFEHGEGVLLTTHTNNADITDLNPERNYDFYVRPMCDASVFGSWGIPVKGTLTRHFWIEMVTSQPEGFVEDADGNISISSAEGLAWLARLAHWRYTNNPLTFQGKTIRLTADINLSAYYWEAISSFSGTFDGEGHTIYNMVGKPNDFISSGGLFFSLRNAIVKNVNLIDCFINTPCCSSACVACGATSSLIYNCFVKGEVIGNDAAGIVSSADRCTIMNCAVIGNIKSVRAYAAGICNVIEKGRILNCYSSVTLSSRAPHLVAGVCSWNPRSEVSNCYSSYYLSSNYNVSAWVNEAICTNLAYYIKKDDEWTICNVDFWTGEIVQDSIPFESGSFSILVDVLNKGVEQYNMDGLRLWYNDTIGVYDGLPLIRNEDFRVICHNIDSVFVRNIKDGNKTGLEVTVSDYSGAEYYEVQYGIMVDEALHQVDSVRTAIINHDTDTIWGLEEGKNYLLKVRAFCDPLHHSALSDEISFVFDKPYWTDVVTKQPQDFVEDAQGNIFVSSAEGLAWLNSVINGLNGQKGDDLEGRTVTILADINMAEYKWKAMTTFSGIFDGKGHVIDNIYVNENTDNQGFFSKINHGEVKNVIFTHAVIRGHEYAGTICGYGDYVKLTNCFAECDVKAFRNAGGLVGRADGMQIENCGTKGTIAAGYNNAGGIAGCLDSRAPFNYMRNSYSNCTVIADNVAGIISGTIAGLHMENCYANGILNAGFWSGGFSGDSNGSFMSNCYTTLYIPNASGFLINDEAPIGIIVGYNYDIAADHVYFPAGSQAPSIGTNYTLYGRGSIIFTDTAGYSMNVSHQLSHPVIIGNTTHNSLFSALNAWVDANNEAGLYRHWVADTANINGGFPIFAPTYTITFLNADGSVLQDEVIEEGVMPIYRGVTPAKAPTAEFNYTFIGWDKTISAVTGDETYTAQFAAERRSYLITFVDEDGTLLASDNVEYGSMPIAPATPTKEATAQYSYTFAGWDSELVAVTGNFTYTATYSSTINKYLITFVDEDGTLLASDNVEYGSMPVAPNAPSKEATAQYTYAFAGWDNELVAVTGEATYTATYSSTINKYLITFVDEDGTLLVSDNVEYGSVPIAPATPTKDATAQYTYNFAGWDSEIVAVTGEATYTATYSSTINRYMVTFYDEDSLTVLCSEEYEYGAMPECDEPSKSTDEQYTYAFAGWSPEVAEVTGEAAYKATYIAELIPTALQHTTSAPQPVKVIEDEKLFIILPDGSKFSATGVKVE